MTFRQQLLACIKISDVDELKGYNASRTSGYWVDLNHAVLERVVLASGASVCTRLHSRFRQTFRVLNVKKSKVNTDIAVRNRNYHTATGNHMPYGITQCTGSGDFSAFTPAEAGTRFSDPGGMQG